MRKYTTHCSIRNKLFFAVLITSISACTAGTPVNHASIVPVNKAEKDSVVTDKAHLQVGADQIGTWYKQLEGKSIAVVANQTSMVNQTHLVDSLLALGVQLKKVFALEHGFRGEVQAGEHVKSDLDKKTGLPIISLYGSHKKPTVKDLEDVDVILFDIQDVGARFYTYISSLHYIMEAVAEQQKEIWVLDRPNPNGFYVDGPVLQMKYKSFVGMHPVPIVHGMTIGEYAQMINGEGWLNKGIKCNLKVIAITNYDHKTLYELPIKPSPNLPNATSIYLYPSLCLFEGTNVSIARGTDFPFQAIGMPNYVKGNFKFTPKSVSAAKNPPHKDVECIGYDLRASIQQPLQDIQQLNLSWLIEFYQNCPKEIPFFEEGNMFVLLSGSPELKAQLKSGKTEAEIRESWKKELDKFKSIRKNYLLYPDFE